MAVPHIRTLARRGRTVLFLERRAVGRLLSRCCLAIATNWAHLYDGVYAHFIEPVSDSRGDGAKSRDRSRATPRQISAIANGRPDTLVLRDGRGHACGAAGGCKLHVGAAQSGRRGKPRHGRRAIRCRVRGVAAVHLRGFEDCLRCAPSRTVPSSETAGGIPVPNPTPSFALIRQPKNSRAG